MRRRWLPRSAVAALLLALAAGGCASTASTAPDNAYFDVVLHPGGAIPASLGYYGGVAIGSPVGFVLGGLLPAPADAVVAREPGRVLGTGIGYLLGAPFHLLALPFGSAGPPEDAPPPPPAGTDPERGGEGKGGGGR